MSVNRPYRRTCRQFVDGKYTEGGRWRYMVHLKFAESPEHYVRAFLIILKDLQELFDHVEPADKNLSCYSYRIHAYCFAHAWRSKPTARRSYGRTVTADLAIGR